MLTLGTKDEFVIAAVDEDATACADVDACADGIEIDGADGPKIEHCII